MASNDYFDRFLSEDSSERKILEEKINALKESSPILDLVEQKKAALAPKSQEKQANFVNHELLFETGFDGDTLFELGRLSAAGTKGFSFDTFETAKYDPLTKALLPYLGKEDPEDGQKRSKKWNLHRAAYAKIHGIPTWMVTQDMLNKAGAEQAETLKAALYKGQDPTSDRVSVDIRQDGVGYFGRPLITVRNPVTGEIINEVMNTRENNAMFYSEYNKKSYIDDVLALNRASQRRTEKIPKGFWDSLGKGLSSGIDNLQATGYGFAALIVDATGNAELANWFLDQYLRNIEEAHANGAQLPGVEDVDWSNPNEALSKLGALIGEAMPSIALMIGTGGLGGLLAKSVVKGAVTSYTRKNAAAIINKAVNRGRAAGAYGSAMGMETGSIYGDVAMEGKRDWKAIAGSLAGGTVAGALEAFYPLKLMGKLGLGKAGAKAAKKSLLGNGLGQNLKNVGKELLSGGLTEGTTEALQFIVEEVTQDLIKQGHLPDFKSEEFRMGLLNSFVAGLVPGATFSGSTASVTATINTIRGDKGATNRESERVRQEARDAADATVEEGDIGSEKALIDTVDTIEQTADTLDVKLDETYAGGSTLEKATQLLDALTRIESEKKGDTSPEVIKAKESLNSALEGYQTGQASTQAAKDEIILTQESNRNIDNIKAEVKRRVNEKTKTGRTKTKGAKAKIRAWGRRQIAAEKKALEKRLEPIRVQRRKGTRAATKVIRETVESSVKKINRINRKLKDPNLSKKQRKRLERERQAEGRHIQSIKRGFDLSPTLNKQLESALNAFDFKDKVDIKTSSQEIDVSMITTKDLVENLKETLKEAVKNPEKITKLVNDLLDASDNLQELKIGLLGDLTNTNNKAAVKSLKTAIKDIDDLQKTIDTLLKSKEIQDIFGEAVEETAENLQSLDFNKINERIENLENLNAQDKEFAKNRNKVADAFKKLKTIIQTATGIKDINEVHSDIIDGDKDGVYKGIKQYLALAQKGDFVLNEYDRFLDGLRLKLAAWNEAFALSVEQDVTIFVDKENNKIYTEDELLKANPKAKKTADNRYDGYWFIDSKSKKLLAVLTQEIEYAKLVREVILDVTNNVRDKTRTEAINARIQEILKRFKKLIPKPKPKGKVSNITGDEEVDEGLKGTQLNAEIIGRFKGAKDAATKLANSEKQTKYVRMIAKLLIPLLSDNIPISTDFKKYTKIDGEIRSHYDPKKKIILINPADDTTALLHELVHAATQTILYMDAKDRTTRQNNAVKQLLRVRENIIKQYEKDIASGDINEEEAAAIKYLLYGASEKITEAQIKVRKRMGMKGEALHEFEALGEFLTQVLTSVDAQSYLKRKEVSDKKQKTLWNEVVTAVRNLLNIKDSKVDSLLDEALAATIESIEALREPKGTLQQRMTAAIEKIAPSKWLKKEQVKTRIATQFIGDGVINSSSYKYSIIYQAEGVANTGNYNSDDIIFISSNGNRKNRVNPVKNGELQGVYKNIDKAIAAGATIIMDTADHLNNTKSYNIGEIALAEYLANNGYVREGQTGVWQSEVVEETTTKFKSVQRFKKAAWTMLDTLQNPDTIFLFGDNLLKKGERGQAIIRSAANAFGIPTKRKPATSKDSYFSDDTFEQNKRDINDAFLAIPDGKNIILSKDGLGTGLAQLEKRAPRTWEYLQGIIKHMEENLDLPPYVVKSTKLSDLEVSITDALIRNRKELKLMKQDLNDSTKAVLAGPIKQMELRIKRLEESLRAAKTVEKKKAKDRISNNILVKLKDKFNDLAGQLKEYGGLKVVDLFRIKNESRDSFFSNNSESTLSKETIIKLVEKVGLEYTTTDITGKKIDGKDKKYVDTLIRNFGEFKEAFNTQVKEDLSKNEEQGGVYLNDGYRIFLDKEGNLPDEVLFAMMISTMHWSAINVNKSKFRPLFAIADLFYGDPKKTRDLTQEQIKSVIDIGIFAKDGANDIGREILDLLNIKAEELSEEEFLKSFEWAQTNDVFLDAVVKDSTIGDRVGTSLALVAIQTARFMNANKKVKGTKGGILQFNRILFKKKLFKFAKWAKDIKGIRGALFWNTITVNEEHPDIQVFKDNAHNLKKIKGDSTFLDDIYEEPVTEENTQEKADKSFWNLPEQVRSLIIKLQNIQWIGKKEELGIFSLLSENLLYRLVGVKNIDEQHFENKDAVEAANEEKRQNIQHVKDYLESGSKPFYFRFKAQIQHRLRIVSNTINGQTSKIHRALFAPVGKPSNIDSDIKLSLFKLAVNQAFGHNIRTAKEANDIFDKIWKNNTVQKLLEAIKDPNRQGEINDLIDELITHKDNKKIIKSTSIKLLKGLVGLSQYNPDGAFETTLTFETDGITNGYAIGLLQFLGAQNDDQTIAEKALYLKDVLKQVGIFIDPNNPEDSINTYERFLANGNLDVYQTFSSSIADAILDEDGDFKDRDRNAVKILHGEFKDAENKLTEFARDLAKNPVMISNYGAGLKKVIDGIINKIVPDLYDNLANIQARYDKANEADKVIIREELQTIQDTLASIGVRTTIVQRLDKKGTDKEGVPKNLYGYTFTKTGIRKINKYFDSIYRGPEKLIETSLESLLAPIKKSRELLTKVVEAEFFIFAFKYHQALAKLPNKSADQEAVRYHIAAELADKYMPRMNGPWSTNENELIQLIKSVTNDDSDNRIRTKHKSILNPRRWKILSKWTRSGRDSDQTSKETSVNSDISEFAGPGVSSVINMVQNMDSVLLGDLLEQKANVLPLFDAVEQRIDDAVENVGIYNKSMIDRNLDHSFLEQTLKQFENIISELKPGEIAEVNKHIQKDSFLAERLLDDVTEDISKEDLQAIKEQIAGMTIEQLQLDLKQMIDDRKAIIEYIEENFSPRDQWHVAQMHIPESILDPTKAPITVEEDETGGTQSSEQNDETQTKWELKGSRFGITSVAVTEFAKLKFKAFSDLIIKNKFKLATGGKIKRFVVWFGELDYAYGREKHKAQKMPKEFSQIARRLEKELNYPEGYFNSVLVNEFPKGSKIAKHSDNEAIFRREDGTIGAVATVTLGGTADIVIRDGKGNYETIEAKNGSVYVMPDGKFQHINTHEVGPAESARISMTFRHIPKNQLTKKEAIKPKIKYTIQYTPKGKSRQTYTVNLLDKTMASMQILNSKGKEVFKNEGADRTAIALNILVRYGDGVMVEYKGNRYVYLPASGEVTSPLIYSVKTKKEMNWAANNGNRIAINKLGEAELAKNTGNTIEDVNIYHGTGDNAILSNLAFRPFEFKSPDGVVQKYISVEHAYQSLKSGKLDWKTYKFPWKDGVKFSGRLKADQKTNVNLMSRLILASFQQNSNARDILLDTGNATLTHKEGTGIWKEKFPEILTRLRAHFVEEEKNVTVEYEGETYTIKGEIIYQFRKYDDEKEGKLREVHRQLKNKNSPIFKKREVIRNAIFALANKAKEELDDYSDDDTLGSINIDIRSDLEEVYRTDTLRDDLQNIFDQLGNLHSEHYIDKNDQNKQQSHLQRVIDEIISKAGSLLDETTVILSKSRIKALGEANIHADGGTVNVNFNRFKPESYAEQTAQEVYLHEVLHVLTRYALKHDSKLKEDLRRIRKQVIKEIEKTEKRPYEIFLHKDKNGKIVYLTDKQAEIDAAKAQYDYVFGNKVPSQAVLDEFLAYSVTNKHLIAKLSTMQSEAIPFWSKEETDTIIEKFLKLLVKVFDSISKILKRDKNPLTVQEEIFKLTKDIVDINQSKRDTVAQALKLDKAGSKLDQANNIVSQFVADVASGTLEKGSDAYIALVDKLTKEGKINGFLANVLYDTKLVAYLGSSYKKFVDNHPEVQERLAVAYRNVNHQTLKILSSLKSDAFGTVDQDFVKLLYKSHDRIDSNRKSFKDNSKKQLQKMFKDYPSLTTREKASITKVLLKTDLSVLFSSGLFTIEEMMELVNDENKLAATIKDYSNKLNLQKNSHYRNQATQLAKIMSKGKGRGYNQWLNATNIYRDNPKKSVYGKDKQDEEIQDLDILISLLALDQITEDTRTDFMNIAKREFGTDDSGNLKPSTHNGIIGVINFHISFKTKSLEKGFVDITGNPNPTLMRKGYIANITDPDTSIEAHPVDKDTMNELLRQGYKYIGPLDKINNRDYGLYVLYNNPETTRTKGIFSMKSMQHKGTQLKEILARDPKNKGNINALVGKYIEKHKKQQKTGTLNSKYTMTPITNDKQEIVDYRIELHHHTIETYLKQDLMFDQVLATMSSQVEDKIKTQEINLEAIKLLDKYGEENQATRPSRFINILDDKYSDEYFKVLPEQAKYEIERRAQKNQKTRKEEFWVERAFLDTVFGYQDASISNIPLIRDMPKTARYARVFEKAWKELVRQAVVNIVVKIPIVPAVNFASNFVTSAMYGIPPTYLVKKQAEGVRELNNYRNWANELQLLDFEILGNPALQNDIKTQNRREQLVWDINHNPVAPFVDQGLFTSITEDINEDEFTYRNKIFSKIKETKGGKLITGKAFDIANHLYLGERTAIFKASMHFLQMSDFIARYALYSYETEVKKIPERKAYKTMIETFVNYDQPLNKYLAYGNDIGAILFVKYFFRIQRAGLNLIKTKPLNAGLLVVGNTLLGLDIETILDSSLLAGNFFPVLGGFEKIFEEVLIPPGLEILMGEGIGLA